MQDVQKLYDARVSGNMLTPGLDIEVDSVEAAYGIQDELLKMQGDSAKGYKISMTSPETQSLFDSHEPVYGPFTSRQVISDLSLKDYNIPLAELELVFYVNEDLSVDDDAKSIMEKCDVAPAIEIPDGRFEDWFPNISKYEVVADCAVSGAIVIGERRKATFNELDKIQGQLYLDGEVVKSGESSEVMDHPVNAILWLIKKLASQGKVLRAGQFVSSGTFILPIQLQVGTYVADFEGIGQVEIKVSE